MSLHSNSSAGGSGVSFSRQQTEYATEMHSWYRRQYLACCTSAGLLWPRVLLLPQYQQQPPLPPHLLGYTPSLQQAGGRHRMSLRGHLGPIRRVVISPSGKDVLTASDDGGVQVICRQRAAKALKSRQWGTCTTMLVLICFCRLVLLCCLLASFIHHQQRVVVMLLTLLSVGQSYALDSIQIRLGLQADLTRHASGTFVHTTRSMIVYDDIFLWPPRA